MLRFFSLLGLIILGSSCRSANVSNSSQAANVAVSCSSHEECGAGKECLPYYNGEDKVLSNGQQVFNRGRTCMSVVMPVFEHDYEEKYKPGIINKGEDLASCVTSSDCNEGLSCIPLRGISRCYRQCDSTEVGSCQAYKGPGMAVCSKPGMVNAPNFPAFESLRNEEFCMVICGGTIPPCSFLPTRSRCDGQCPQNSECAPVGTAAPVFRCI